MSLRLRLTLIIGSSFVLLWLLAAGWLLHDLRQQTMQAFDQRLTASARMVAGLLEQMPQQSSSPALFNPTSAAELGIPNELACQVSSLQGEILASSSRTTGQPLPARQPGFAEQELDGAYWRSFTLQHGDLLITTADRLAEREQLSTSALLAAGIPVGLALLGSLLMLWLASGRGLAPLQHMQEALAQRNADSLEPLAEHPWPRELRPLVASQNALFARITSAFAREKQLTHDLAHELRSPLTAIKTHLQIARRSSPEVAQQSLALAEAGSDRLQHTLEQLLLLARLDGQLEASKSPQADAAEITRMALADLGAVSRDIELHWRIEHAQTPIAVPAVLAIAALRNLLENALRHGPETGQKTLTVSRTQEQLVWTVTDGGGELPPEALTQLTQRFWRASADQRGSGLGLAIVSAICQRFGGSLELSNSLAGVCARLALPLIPPPAQNPSAISQSS
ncbi:MAG: ATP-binding protein [Gammaproteobacteria bacterium]|nr:ATP-binding protein [Gammaproteobacteria bacterium]